MCELCGKRAVGTGPDSGYEDRAYCIDRKWCLPCGNEGQHEISHDNGHESIPTEECWLCNPEMNEATRDHIARKGHTNTVAKSRNTHAYCTHERTPQGRERCRKARAVAGSPIATDWEYKERTTTD